MGFLFIFSFLEKVGGGTNHGKPKSIGFARTHIITPIMRTVPNQFSAQMQQHSKPKQHKQQHKKQQHFKTNLRLFLFAQSPPPPANMFSLKYNPLVPLYGELETSRPCVTAATFLAVVMVWAWKKRDILMKKQFLPHSHAVTSLHQGFTVSLRLGGCFI